MSPDGTLTEIGDFDFKDHEKLEILAKYESAKSDMLMNLLHMLL